MVLVVLVVCSFGGYMFVWWIIDVRMLAVGIQRMDASVNTTDGLGLLQVVLVV